MRKALFLLSLLLVVLPGNTRQNTIDSLKKLLPAAKADSSKLEVLMRLSDETYLSAPDTSIVFAQQCYELAVKYHNRQYETMCTARIANLYSAIGDYARSIQFYFKALRMHESAGNEPGIIVANNNIGVAYNQKGDYQTALLYLKKSQKGLELYDASHTPEPYEVGLKVSTLNNIGECYLGMGKLDSAEFCLQQSYGYEQKTKDQYYMDYVLRDLGEIAAARGNKAAALHHFFNALSASKKQADVQLTSVINLSIANLYYKFKQLDSAVTYAQQALQLARSGNFRQDALNASQALYRYYDDGHNLAEAFTYYKMAMGIKDSLFNEGNTRLLLSVDFDEKQRQLDIAAAQERYSDKVRFYALLAGLAVLLLLVFVFWRNSNQRKKANRQLQMQKEELQAAFLKLEQTQTQLIQSEKMASLGELTAGIAHEIQNPLNFVNNFSEVSNELIDELLGEKAKVKSEKDKQLEDELLADIKQNLEKINHHGKRADAIVKGMLQHSRKSSGVKEPTDINALADEYLRLAYHGLRAKDKSFNAELITHFDSRLPKINMAPQDVGRVLVNLFNNAFYAVREKNKTAASAYKPAVEVTTALQNGQAIIAVKDNGTGIPGAIKEKIMQPFFTTKPTGEGTGLGLSLSYDIVVKGHGGAIEVNSAVGEFTEFIISLPLKA